MNCITVNCQSVTPGWRVISNKRGQRRRRHFCPLAIVQQPFLVSRWRVRTLETPAAANVGQNPCSVH
jgi:hypothetical protein